LSQPSLYPADEGLLRVFLHPPVTIRPIQEALQSIFSAQPIPEENVNLLLHLDPDSKNLLAKPESESNVISTPTPALPLDALQIEEA
jgi:hypothetical protein